MNTGRFGSFRPLVLELLGGCEMGTLNRNWAKKQLWFDEVDHVVFVHTDKKTHAHASSMCFGRVLQAVS